MLDQIALFVVLGLGSGALIAAIATGIVLFHRGSGMINIGTAAVALSGAYVYYLLRAEAELPIAVSFGLALVACAALGALIELAVVRPLRAATPLAKLVASLGIMLLIQSVVVLVFGTTTRQAPPVLAATTVVLFGTPVPVDRFLLAGVVVLVAAALTAIYRYTRFGLATRAAAQNQESAMLCGLSPGALSLTNTLCASVVSGAFGILVAPLITLSADQMVVLVIPALAAALLAGFTSFAIACAAGLGLGVLDSLVTLAQSSTWFPTVDGVPVAGIRDVLLFLVIVVLLYVKGSALPQRGALVEQRLPDAPRARWVLRPAVVAAVVGAVALVWLPFDFRNALVLSLIGIVYALSLTVLTGLVGQVSLLQMAVAGVAAFTVSRAATGLGLGFLPAAAATRGARRRGRRACPLPGGARAVHDRLTAGDGRRAAPALADTRCLRRRATGVATLTGMSDPTGLSSPVGQAVVVLMLLASLTLLIRWWVQNRRR
ncbi:branched-chain amino acid ABC transporter permease [Pseudonocardia pini]|uniref:branched-chain amino acid ABC transporter permease n=1 Tax=Pseudonocardia pini TaxID=2758030 RepID=UPI0015EFE1D1|nr:branched-chain amino acid ABC transporter permease [Pseudonocardia pini]